MPKTLYLFAGHVTDGAKKDSGAVSGAYVEAVLTKDLRDRLLARLKALGVSNIVSDSDAESLSELLKRVSPRTSEGDLLVDIHFNAFPKPSANGTEVIVRDGASQEEKAFGGELLDALVSFGFQKRGGGVISEAQSARGRLGVLRTKAVSALIEVCFISSVKDMPIYLDKKDEIVSALANVIIKRMKK